MITADTTAAVKSLEAIKAKIQDKLEGMVRSFAIDVAEGAIRNTPIGDAEKYADLYHQRFLTRGLLEEEGLAKGNWQVGVNKSPDTFQENYGKNSNVKASQQVIASVQDYQLGDQVIVGNPLYYIGHLDGKNADIRSPTMQEIQNLYRGAARLKDHYDES